MSERLNITFATGSASPGNPGPRSARLIIVGQTGLGPADGPQVVRSMSEYVQRYGTRTQGSAMHDAAEMFLDRAAAGELVVMRAQGPSAVKATVGLDSSKIVATAKNAGSAYNSWTVAYTSATKTVTLVKGAVTVTYSGTDAATLQAAAAVDPDVTVTVSSLPSGDVSAANLATGTDDFANVVWATTLALIPDSIGSGAICCPGVAFGTVGAALAAHAKTNRRLALLSLAAGSSVATAVAAGATVAGYTGGENAVVCFPSVKVSDGANGVKTIDPTSYVGALRSIAQRQLGLGTSPIQRQVSARVTGVTPELAIGSADWASLVAAHVNPIRTLAIGTALDGWHTAAAPSGNVNLYGAQFRDLANAAAADCADVLERFVGREGTSTVLAQAGAELAGVLDGYTQWLKPEYDSAGALLHKGYKVTVNNGANPADNRITAVVSMRFAEYAEFIDFTIATADAGAAI